MTTVLCVSAVLALGARAGPLPEAAVLEVDGISDNLIDHPESAEDPDPATDSFRAGVASAGRFHALSAAAQKARMATRDGEDLTWRDCDGGATRCARQAGKWLGVPTVFTAFVKRWPGGTWFVLRRLDVASGRSQAILTDRQGALSDAEKNARLELLGRKLALAPSRPEPRRRARPLEEEKFETVVEGEKAVRLVAALEGAGLAFRADPQRAAVRILELEGIGCQVFVPKGSGLSVLGRCTPAAKTAGAAVALHAALQSAGALVSTSVSESSASASQLRCEAGPSSARCAFLGY